MWEQMKPLCCSSAAHANLYSERTSLQSAPSAAAGRSPLCRCTRPCPQHHPCQWAAAQVAAQDQGNRIKGEQQSCQHELQGTLQQVLPSSTAERRFSRRKGSQHAATAGQCMGVGACPLTWHVTHRVWHSWVLPLLNSPYSSVMLPVSMPPAGSSRRRGE